jgi:hypothetical protein
MHIKSYLLRSFVNVALADCRFLYCPHSFIIATRVLISENHLPLEADVISTYQLRPTTRCPYTYPGIVVGNRLVMFKKEKDVL